MYGLILENIAAFLKSEYSKQTWEEICIIADLQTEDYETHTVYSEGEFSKEFGRN